MSVVIVWYAQTNFTVGDDVGAEFTLLSNLMGCLRNRDLAPRISPPEYVFSPREHRPLRMEIRQMLIKELVCQTPGCVQVDGYSFTIGACDGKVAKKPGGSGMYAAPGILAFFASFLVRSK